MRGRVCVKESFDLGNPDDENDQPNLWPSEESLPGLRAFLEMFFKECEVLVRHVLDALSVALNLPPEDYCMLARSHSQGRFKMSLLHYPALPMRDVRSGARDRMPAHSDFGTLTLLFQDGGGLEIAELEGSADGGTSAAVEETGRFRKVEPRPGTVVVNVGYLLMRWSNGRWKSAVHRVVGPANLKAGEDDETLPDRYSVPFFASPDPQTVVEALPGCWSVEVPKRWKAIHAGEYLDRKKAGVYVQ